jgi:hypothetical protein
MSDEQQGKSGAVTVPPPDGAEDPYSASTRVGQAPLDLLALVRAAEESAGKLEAASKAPSDPPAVAPAARATPVAPAPKIEEPKVEEPKVVEAKVEPPAKKPSVPAPAKEEPRASRKPEAAPIATPSRAPSAQRAPESDGLPPIPAILLVLGAIALALAAIVR